MTARLRAALRLLAAVLWPPSPQPTPAAIHYFESVLEERRAR